MANISHSRCQSHLSGLRVDRTGMGDRDGTHGLGQMHSEQCFASLKMGLKCPVKKTKQKTKESKTFSLSRLDLKIKIM